MDEEVVIVEGPCLSQLSRLCLETIVSHLPANQALALSSSTK